MEAVNGGRGSCWSDTAVKCRWGHARVQFDLRCIRHILNVCYQCSKLRFYFVRPSGAFIVKLCTQDFSCALL